MPAPPAPVPCAGLEARRPTAEDIVVLPEAGHHDLFLACHLSEAATVVAVLAPPGLCGWDFTPGWEQPDPMTVPLDAVATPASFRTLAALDCTLWTNARGTAAAGVAAGVDVTWIGTGTPVPFAEPGPKTFDVAVVERNRWYDWAVKAADDCGDVRVLTIPPRDSTYSLCDDLARARLLLWPSRIEGMSRIAREARGVATVPVVLDTNPFSTAEDHGPGVVLVRDHDEMARRARELLADPAALARLGTSARTGARAQVEWDPFVGRVADALEVVPVAVGGHVRSGFGRRLAPAGRVAAEVESLQNELADTTLRLHAEMATSAARAEEVAALHATVESLFRDLASARAELTALRRRKVVRLMDDTPVGRIYRRVW